MLVVLEGGYNLKSIALSSEAVVRTLLNGDFNRAEQNVLLRSYYLNWKSDNEDDWSEEKT
jgi:hypothetical protein